jgi:hypothetical protein
MNLAILPGKINFYYTTQFEKWPVKPIRICFGPVIHANIVSMILRKRLYQTGWPPMAGSKHGYTALSSERGIIFANFI